jgi:hypothetical protein
MHFQGACLSHFYLSSITFLSHGYLIRFPPVGLPSVKAKPNAGKPTSFYLYNKSQCPTKNEPPPQQQVISYQ